MPTDLPSSDYSGEDVHEHSDIDETFLETDVGNIADPDLIRSRDLKGLNSIDPGVLTFKGSRGLTDRRVSPILRDSLLSSIGQPVYTRQCILDAVATL